MKLADDLICLAGRTLGVFDRAIIAPLADPLVRRSNDRKFFNDVSDILIETLISNQASIVVNDECDLIQNRHFDEAVVTIRSPELRLRLVRVRGQLDLQLSSPDEDMPWTDVNLLVLSPHDKAKEEPAHNWNDQNLPQVNLFFEKTLVSSGSLGL